MPRTFAFVLSTLSSPFHMLQCRRVSRIHVRRTRTNHFPSLPFTFCVFISNCSAQLDPTDSLALFTGHYLFVDGGWHGCNSKLQFLTLPALSHRTINHSLQFPKFHFHAETRILFMHLACALSHHSTVMAATAAEFFIFPSESVVVVAITFGHYLCVMKLRAPANRNGKRSLLLLLHASQMGNAPSQSTNGRRTRNSHAHFSLSVRSFVVDDGFFAKIIQKRCSTRYSNKFQPGAAGMRRPPSKLKRQMHARRNVRF